MHPALTLVNAGALISWSSLLVHALHPVLGGVGLKDEKAWCIFMALQALMALEVGVITFQRKISIGSLVQTTLGITICLFRVTTVVFALPLLENDLLHKALLAGWAFSDSVRYMALLGKQVAALQVARRLISSVMFALVASCEIWAVWSVLWKTSGGTQHYLKAQLLVTLIGLPIGTYLFLRAARKTNKDK
ncbi:unnamed protein product [Effrenium voratum]|uniref:Very-long-chain (3R)-3-hydroxyacyl-CoA dehydratase n=1 Tax=Effrenium voratum TaxID=2562239 RepID=A0AA36NGX9_9DINO|nr:unnamed protein product [Effrenium voratum]CAJ1412278.1 unnamed protein product [Effrenium voratum]